MSAKPKAGSVRSKYEFMKAHRKKFATEAMCRVMGVASSGYCEWLQRPRSDRAIENERLLRLIRASFTASQGVYGAPRVFLDLREAGETCSKHPWRVSCGRTACAHCTAIALVGGSSESRRSSRRTS